ncbi:hypothetical protein C2G38_2216342 [Gigaspora rosea]|uniref:Uncharacterized protein n=1 Tax=Gigaspora rosea TaxID=44941 RepID=A0A397UHB9_9GLOM|nr:hypothetical protein C2G38_2216342 [Gigaspora rosea]
MLQSVDKEKKFKKEEKLGQLNKKGSLMRFKKLFRTLKLDYDIFFWIKSFNDTETTIYKDETKLLKDFKQYVFRKGNKKDKKVAKDVDALVDNCLVKIEESFIILNYIKMCQFCIELQELDNKYIFTKNYLKDAQNFNQTIHLNEDKNLLKTDNEIEFPKPENNPPEQYKSKEWNIVVPKKIH